MRTSATATIQNKTDQKSCPVEHGFIRTTGIVSDRCTVASLIEKKDTVRAQRVTRLLSSFRYLASSHVLAGVEFCPEAGLSGYRSQALTLLLRNTKLALLGT